MKVRTEILPLSISMLKEAVDDLPEPVLLLDPELRLVHMNAPAEPLFSSTQLWASTWRDPAATGRPTCLAPVLLGRPCSGAGACEGCLLHDTLAHSLSRGESVAPFDVERTRLEHGRILTSTFELTARAVTADDATGFIVTLREVASSRGNNRLMDESCGFDEMRRPA